MILKVTKKDLTLTNENTRHIHLHNDLRYPNHLDSSGNNHSNDSTQSMTHTPYYQFVNRIEKYDITQRKGVMKSYQTHVEMGFPNLYQLFKAGKEHEYCQKLGL